MKHLAPAAPVLPPAADGGHLAVLRQLLPYLWPQDRADLRWRVAVAMLALFASKIVTVWAPFAYKHAVDALTAAGNPAAVAVAVPVALIVAYAVGRVMMVVLAQIRDALFARVGQHAVRELSVKTFRHLHALSLRFHLDRRTGGLARVISRGTNGIDTLLRYSLFNTFPTLLELLLVCGILAWNFGWLYAVVVFVTVVVYIAFTYSATEWRIGIRRSMNDADTDASTKAVDSLLNFETVKYFNNEEHEASRFDRSMQKYEKAAIRTWVSLAVLNSGQALLFTVGLGIVMLMSAYEVAAGRQTVGDFVLVNALMIQLYLPLNFMGSVYRDIRQGLIDVEEMFKVLAVGAEIADRPGATPLKVTAGEVRFDDVSFHYDRERPILRHVSFTVPPGRSVAIVGPSGAGKSTISRLLYRFYEVTGGRIVIDGQDVAGVTQRSLRNAIGMVPQDTVLFNDTIRYNIEYGRPGAAQAEIEAAAKLARIHEFVLTLPKGYDTIVGERGLKLSGGEKQRVSIARTILKAPPILVLDEATSALDTMTEQEIQAALRQVSKDRTTLVIAHRLSTIIDADEIIVLEDGRIVERGDHKTLLDHRGVYARMWNRQREADEARRRLAEAADERAVVADSPSRAEATGR